MLLKENYQILCDLSKSLNQTHFPNLRSLMKNYESVANKKCKLTFLKKCLSMNLFPKTIDNVRFPEFLNKTKFRNVILKLKLTILKSAIKDYY